MFSYLLAHHFPVSIFEARVTEAVDQWHVNLERLQLLFDCSGCFERSSKFWLLKLLCQLISSSP